MIPKKERKKLIRALLPATVVMPKEYVTLTEFILASSESLITELPEDSRALPVLRVYTLPSLFFPVLDLIIQNCQECSGCRIGGGTH